MYKIIIHIYLKQQAKLDESTNQWTRLQTKTIFTQPIVFSRHNIPLLQKLQCKSNTPSIFINCLSFTRLLKNLSGTFHICP
uniref:Uncharacterized protein n=1 Tax=Setaria italica TaxID=4555 RepID=K3YBB3_SETIT